MIFEIVGLLFSQIGISAISLIAYHKFCAKKQQKYISNQLTPTESTGLITEEVDNSIVMSTDEHLKYLISLYPQAAKDYKRYHKNSYLKSNADRYILRLINEVENGNLEISLTSHHMRFSNGDDIWIANKYYAYGNLTSSKDNQHCCFETSSARISLYTFMRLIHLEETYFDPVLRFENKLIRVSE